MNVLPMTPSPIRALMRAAKRTAGDAEALGLLAWRSRPLHPPLFIVGAPRCGTTLPYLHLIRHFRFAYFPNAAKRYPWLPFTAGAAVCTCGEKPFDMQSRYGAVRGLSAPSDGWEIFHRWFPRYALEPARLDRLWQLRAIVGGYERLFAAPFINKNNHNSVRIDELNAVFPDALFVHVTRDALDATLSLLDARRMHAVEPNQWWSCPAPQYMGHTFDSETEQAACTIVGIRDHVRDQLSMLGRDRWMELAYEDFCGHPEQFCQWVASRYDGQLQVRGSSMSRTRYTVRSGAADAAPELVAEIEITLRTLQKGPRQTRRTSA